jgi:hypothetical protein
MFVVVNLNGRNGDDKKSCGFEVASFWVDKPNLFLWALKSMLKSAQAVWPEELGEVMIVNKYTGQPVEGKK